jgi:hypothetical protein
MIRLNAAQGKGSGTTTSSSTAAPPPLPLSAAAVGTASARGQRTDSQLLFGNVHGSGSQGPSPDRQRQQHRNHVLVSPEEHELLFGSALPRGESGSRASPPRGTGRDFATRRFNEMAWGARPDVAARRLAEKWGVFVQTLEKISHRQAVDLRKQPLTAATLAQLGASHSTTNAAVRSDGVLGDRVSSLSPEEEAWLTGDAVITPASSITTNGSPCSMMRRPGTTSSATPVAVVPAGVVPLVSAPAESEPWVNPPRAPTAVPLPHSHVDDVVVCFLDYAEWDARARSWGGDFDYTIDGASDSGRARVQAMVRRHVEEAAFAFDVGFMYYAAPEDSAMYGARAASDDLL